MQRQSVTFSSLSDISYDMTLCYDETEQLDIIIIAFQGEYGVGSLGSGDGRFISAITHAALSAWLPAGIILDFRTLSYEFGDTLLDAVNAGCDASVGIRVPMRIVVSERSRNGIVNLLKYAKQDPKMWLYPTMEGAMDSLIAAIGDD